MIRSGKPDVEYIIWVEEKAMKLYKELVGLPIDKCEDIADSLKAHIVGSKRAVALPPNLDPIISDNNF